MRLTSITACIFALTFYASCVTAQTTTSTEDTIHVHLKKAGFGKRIERKSLEDSIRYVTFYRDEADQCLRFHKQTVDNLRDSLAQSEASAERCYNKVSELSEREERTEWLLCAIDSINKDCDAINLKSSRLESKLASANNIFNALWNEVSVLNNHLRETKLEFFRMLVPRCCVDVLERLEKTVVVHEPRKNRERLYIFIFK